MGFGGGSDDSAENQANQLMQQQMQANEAELEYKRQALTEQRMAIIKSQGAQSFIPDPIVGVSSPSPSPSGSGFGGLLQKGVSGFGQPAQGGVGSVIKGMEGK